MKLDLSQFPRMGDAITRHLFHVFADRGVLARFVGGCVRDAVLGKAAQDIDIAVPIPPEETLKILTNAHLQVIPTGYDFGTVTAVIEGREFQITSLREDWETDGRRAKVTYGADWERDAARRDFTINALYADLEGTVLDYFNGLVDLEAGVIRFIGDPHQRIREDYLRILRYFRFLAWYGKGALDQHALQACAALKEGLQGLSRERIGHEVLKLLAASCPLQSLTLLTQAGLCPFLFPAPLKPAINLKALETLLKLEPAPSALRRLAALFLPSLEPDGLAQALRLSNAQNHYLRQCQDRLGNYPSTSQTFRQNLYWDGPELFFDLTLLSLSLRPSPSIITAAEEAGKQAAAWNRPLFPLRGQDLIEAGMKPGPQLGKLLKACEEWWAAQDFQPTRDDCLHWVKEGLSGEMRPPSS